MGVYDHLLRPSMGHKMQTDLRHSMQRYHDDRELLQHSLSQLRLHSRQLTTSPAPNPKPSRPALPDKTSVKRWGDPDSPFSKAPEVAAHRARLAQLQQEKSSLSHSTHGGNDRDLRVSHSSLLPPISDSTTTTLDDTASGPGQQAANRDRAKNQAATTRKPTTSANRAEKGKRAQKKRQAAAAAARKVKDMPLALPTIPSAGEDQQQQRRAVWDSGRHHLQVQRASTHLERNSVDEECRTFSHRSVLIPPISDPRRTEIRKQVAPAATTTATTKVQFRRAQPPHPTPYHNNPERIEREQTKLIQSERERTKLNQIERERTKLNQIERERTSAQNRAPSATQQPINSRQPPPPAPPSATKGGNRLSRSKPTVDHFPLNTPRLPELDDASTDSEGEADDDAAAAAADDDDGDKAAINTRGRGGGGQQVSEGTSLPALPQRNSLANQQQASQPVPPLRLRRGMTPSAKSTLTFQSGATGATYMSLVSQDTQEWKGAYVRSEDPYLKARMLTEILHATHQRMQDNAEDLRLSVGAGPWDGEGEGAEVMLLHRDSTAMGGSGATTARSTLGEKVLKLPHHRHKKRGAHKESQQARLHRYLNKLSLQRRLGEGGGKQQQQQRHHRGHHRRHHHPLDPAPIPLAAMTIREITQSSLDRQSAVHITS